MFKSARKVVLLSGLALAATALIGAGVSNANFAWSGSSVTEEESQKMHQTVFNMKDHLINAILGGVKYDTISYSGTLKRQDVEPYIYVDWKDPTEPARKKAKLEYAKNLAKELGFPRVVQRDDAMYVYAEFGDPDAPEMVMALSHLDSPTGSVSTSNMPRWVNSPWTPYIKDGWMYGCGLQDDSGPTLATLFGAKALMDNGYAIDRRIRVAMGAYEDGGPSASSMTMKEGKYTPAAEGGLTTGFYDNWCYLMLHQEEFPIGSFTSDSRFPVIYGNTVSWNCNFTKDISADTSKDFSLLSAELDVTRREGDSTLKDIIYGSGIMVPSRVVFTLALPADATGGTTSAGDYARMDFQAKFNLAIANAGWTVDDFKYDYSTTPQKVIVTIDTGKAMEVPTPSYGGNAFARMMYGLSQALPDGLAFKGVATDLAHFFAPDGVEDVRGYNLGCGGKHAEMGWEMITVALGYSSPSGFASPFNPATGVFTTRLYTRSLWETKAESDSKWDAHVAAFTGRGWTKTSGNKPAGLPTLYTPATSPLVKTMFETYQFALAQPGFDDTDEIFKGATPLGTTGGTLASSYYGKMIAYGAVIPGNERWWHAPNERMSVNSAIQMTKLYTDGYLALARYAGPAGAQLIQADVAGYDCTRSGNIGMGYIDVTLDTYKDAKTDVTAEYLDGKSLLAATKFSIPVFAKWNTSTLRTDAIALGHESGGIYLNEANMTTPLLLPMRLEMKLTKAETGVSDSTWAAWKNEDINSFMKHSVFKAVTGGEAVTLEAPEGEAEKYFFKRTSQYSDNIYVSVFIAVADENARGIEVIKALSKMPTFGDENNRYADTNAEERGFFLIKDGNKDGKFTSPIIFVASDKSSASSGGSGGCNSGIAGLMALLAAPAIFFRRRKG